LKDYNVFISKIVIDEINKTSSSEKKEKLLNTIKDYKLEIFDQTNLDIEQAADAYIQNGIIPPNKREDAFHLAFASYYEFDILLSWNFKHLANIKIQEKVNLINIQLGFRKYLLLFNPMEVIMTSRIDKSLIEVWEMKDKAYKDFIDSGNKNYSDYLDKSTEETIKKYQIRTRIKEKIEE